MRRIGSSAGAALPLQVDLGKGLRALKVALALDESA
jgi:hypothetical protein